MATAAINNRHISGGLASLPFFMTLVLSMSVTFATYFLAVPWIGHQHVVFSVSQGVTNQLGTTYEIAKCVGLVVYGVRARHMHILTLTVCGFLVYGVLALGLGLDVDFNPGKTTADLVAVFVLYAGVSATCIISQFGLATIKQLTHKTAEGKRLLTKLISIQGLIAATLQSASPFLGSSLSQVSRGAPFYLMAATGVVLASLLWFFRPRPFGNQSAEEEEKEKEKERTHSADPASTPQCGSSSSQSQSECECVENAKSQSPQSYWQQLWMLCTDARFASFRSYVFVLGISTSALYVYPLLANNALVAAGTSPTTATLLIFAVTVPNILVRAAMLIRPVCKDVMVLIGMTLQLLGAATMLVSVLVVGTTAGGDPHTAIMVVILPGVLISAGVGACQPNCKSGAMLDVSDQMSATAASLLKLLQLLWVALMQAVSGGMAANVTTAVRDQSMLLTAVCVLGLVWLLAHRSAALRLQTETDKVTTNMTIETAEQLQLCSSRNSALGIV